MQELRLKIRLLQLIKNVTLVVFIKTKPFIIPGGKQTLTSFLAFDVQYQVASTLCGDHKCLLSAF